MNYHWINMKTNPKKKEEILEEKEYKKMKPKLFNMKRTPWPLL